MRAAGWLWATAGAAPPLALLLPGFKTDNVPLLLAIAGICVVWAAVCFTVPPARPHPLVFHVPAALGFVLIAIATAAMGGHDAPVRFFAFFVVIYAAYFFSARAAAPYVAAGVLVHAAPLAYDGRALPEGFLGELTMVVPAYLTLGYVIVVCKRQLDDAREHAETLSRTDALTGLANRRALTAMLDRRLGGSRASDALGLLLLDLDGFKDANTLYGHPGGDRVLVEVARALAEACRLEDFPARLGGDEFAVIVRGADRATMEALAPRLLAAVRDAGRALSDLPGYRVRASAGWALFPQHASTIQELIVAADLALRAAKLRGKDRSLSPFDFEGATPWHDLALPNLQDRQQG